MKSQDDYGWQNLNGYDYISDDFTEMWNCLLQRLKQISEYLKRILLACQLYALMGFSVIVQHLYTLCIHHQTKAIGLSLVFKFSFIYLIFMCACLDSCAPCVCRGPQRSEGGLEPLELELHKILRKKPGSSVRAMNPLITESSPTPFPSSYFSLRLEPSNSVLQVFIKHIIGIINCHHPNLFKMSGLTISVCFPDIQHPFILMILSNLPQIDDNFSHLIQL